MAPLNTNKSRASELTRDGAADQGVTARNTWGADSAAISQGNHGLSQAEMTALLSGLDGASADSLADPNHSRRLQARQFQVLKHCHDVLCRQLSIDWQRLIGCSIHVSLKSIDEYKYESLMGMLGECCTTVAEVNKAGGQLLLALEQSILLPIVHSMLGSSDQRQPQPSQPLTKVELKLAARAIKSLLSLYEQAWDGSSICLKLGEVQNSIPKVSITPGDEFVAVATLQVEIGQLTGQVRIAWPLELLAEVIPSSSTPPASDEPQNADQIHVRLPSFELNQTSLEGLEVGQILQTDINAETPVEVHLKLEPKFVGSLGAANGNKAVRVTGMANEIPDENA